MNAYRVTFAEPQDGKPLIVIGDDDRHAIKSLEGKKIASLENLGPVTNLTIVDPIVETVVKEALKLVEGEKAAAEATKVEEPAEDRSRKSINVGKAEDSAPIEQEVEVKAPEVVLPSIDKLLVVEDQSSNYEPVEATEETKPVEPKPKRKKKEESPDEKPAA